MKAIDAIVAAYINLNDEGALVSLKMQRQRLLLSTDEKSPFFSKVREQCIEDLAVIEAALAKISPAGALSAQTGATEAKSDEAIGPSVVPFLGHREDGGLLEMALLDPELQISDSFWNGKELRSPAPAIGEADDPGSFVPRALRSMSPDIYFNFQVDQAWMRRSGAIISAASLLKVSRNSDAWQVNRAGDWSRFSPHELAVSDLGAAIWEPSANLVWFSNIPIEENGWLLEGGWITVQRGEGPGPDLDAYLCEDGSISSSSHWLSAPQTLDLQSGAAYTVSFFVKSVSAQYVQIALPAIAFGTEAYANFDIQNGVVGAIGPSASARIRSFPNSWHRCEVTTISKVAAKSQTVRIRSIPNVSTDNVVAFPGANRKFLLWNCQMEEKSASTAPIVTAGSIGVRERCCVSTAKDLQFGASYSMWARGVPRTPNAYPSLQAIVELFADGFNRSSQRRDAATAKALTALVGRNGGSLVPSGSPIWQEGISGALATAFASRNQCVAFDGVLGASHDFALPATPSRVIIGAGNNGNGFWWNGDVEEVAIWLNKRLPDVLLQTITK